MPLERAIEATLRRERVVVLASLSGLSLLAWAYLALAAANDPHAGMTMPMPNVPIAIRIDTLALTFAMWAIMMVGMMLPGATPMILTYTNLARRNRERGRTLPSVSLFVSGYLLAWTAFSVGAAALQIVLERFALMSPMSMTVSATLGGFLLLMAGIYQWLPIKDVCLRNCQSPLQFLLLNWRNGRVGALRMGVAHGVFCLGCCWALMLTLFAVGIMNLAWVALLAGLTLIEKLLPGGVWSARVIGVCIAGAGVWQLARVYAIG